MPEALSPEGLPSKINRVRYYRGIKEDVYVPEFEPSPGLLKELGLGEDEMIVTVRPPANEAHYYNPESDVLFHELMARICGTPGVRAVLLPRNAHQEQAMRDALSGVVHRRPDGRSGRGYRRIEPDLDLRPRRQRRGDDEPRGGGLGRARL